MFVIQVRVTRPPSTRSKSAQEDAADAPRTSPTPNPAVNQPSGTGTAPNLTAQKNVAPNPSKGTAAVEFKTYEWPVQPALKPFLAAQFLYENLGPQDGAKYLTDLIGDPEHILRHYSSAQLYVNPRGEKYVGISVKQGDPPEICIPLTQLSKPEEGTKPTGILVFPSESMVKIGKPMYFNGATPPVSELPNYVKIEHDAYMPREDITATAGFGDKKPKTEGSIR